MTKIVEVRSGYITSKKRVLDFIKVYYAINGYGPSVRDVAKGLGFDSSNTAFEHMRSLLELGVLKQVGDVKPTMVPVRPIPIVR